MGWYESQCMRSFAFRLAQAFEIPLKMWVSSNNNVRVRRTYIIHCLRRLNAVKIITVARSPSLPRIQVVSTSTLQFCQII